MREYLETDELFKSLASNLSLCMLRKKPYCELQRLEDQGVTSAILGAKPLSWKEGERPVAYQFWDTGCH